MMQKILSLPYRKAVPVALALIGVLGMALLALSTRLGPGVGGDATIYISSARNLITGKGLGLISASGAFRLLPYFPPFFSLLLAGAGKLGLDMVASANVLNILMFAGLVWLVGFVTWHSDRSWILPMIAAGVIATSPILVPVYSWAMSEPVAILLGFASLALLLAYVQKPERSGIFVLSALSCGFGILTRYANAAFLATGVILLLVFLSTRWRPKLIDAVVYGLIGLLPVAIWVTYDLSMTATVSSRSMVSGIGERLANLFPSLADVFILWLMPESWTDVPRFSAHVFQAVVLIAGAALAAWLIVVALRFLKLRKAAQDGAGVSGPPVAVDDLWRWIAALVIFIAVYLVEIGAVSIATYPPITIASRMLSPVHVAGLWLLVLLAAATIRLWPKLRWLGITLPVLLLAFSATYTLRSVRIVQMYDHLGLGYNSKEWRESQTIQALKSLPTDKVIVTNEETAVLFLTGRAAYPVMEIYTSQPYEQFTSYGQGDLDKDTAQRLFHDGKAQLVLFDTIENQFSQVYGDRAAERVKVFIHGLVREFHGSDGNIYRYPVP
jgi:hypothetical protein